MRLISWNVNGFRSVLKKGFLDWLVLENPDVLSLQEIRCEWEELAPSVQRALSETYEVCWFPARSKKGYSGAATLTRKGLIFNHQPGIGEEDFDREGRLIVSRHAAFTLIAGYFPNAADGLVRLPYKRAFAQHLARDMEARHARGERLIVVGDMNVAPEPIDLANPSTNQKSAGFTDEEREDFRGYLRAGLRDVFREKNPETPGLYTWWSVRSGARPKNIGWRIDIFLVSEALVGSVVEAKIHPEVQGSDHCPVSLHLSL
jgi:exodeoxyribonuclease-3